MKETWRALGRVEGFAEGSNIFSEDDDDKAYFVNGRQVANLVEGEVALRLTRKLISANRPRLNDDERVSIRGASDWIGVRVTSRKDIALAVELAEMIGELERPPPGVTAKPPPTGAELARRRKFH